jgi:EAL domain-containing protein (putative c-di-GMP-specific phosphodiesterase class I)
MNQVMPMETTKPRVLLADDDLELLQANERILRRAGFDVRTATNGADALEQMLDQAPEVIVSDISMPRMDGVELLRRVRERDLDLPVILITSQPTLDTAVLGIQYGAHRYLVKPVAPKALADVVRQATRLYAWARLRRQAVAELGRTELSSDRAGAEATFERALATLFMAYQPIVSSGSRRVVAYEALMRSSESSLPSPLAVIACAERLGRHEDLGRAVRRRVSELLDTNPDSSLDFYVNLHVRDLTDLSLYSPNDPLARHAKRVVLELTERAALDDVPDIRHKVISLREMGYRIAIDDLGAGYAGLTSFAQLEPDVVKVDMSLVRNVHAEPIKQRLVRSVCTLGKDLGMQVIVEGVETAKERDKLVQLGCDWMQGYHYGFPQKELAPVKWEALT